MLEPAAPWMSEPAVAALLSLLLDRLDRLPANARTRPPGIRVNDRTMPQLFDAEDPGVPAYIWLLVERMAALGWITIKPGRPQMGKAAYEVEPAVLLTLSKEGEIRSAIGRAPKLGSYLAEWAQVLSGRGGMSEALLSYLKKRPIRVPGHSAHEVADRLFDTRALENEPLFLREVSGRLFWGHAKTLDRRSEMVARILGKAECPFPELPVLIHSHCECSHLKGILFVENEATFLSGRVRQRARELGFAMFFASGFKLAAARLRSADGSHLFHSTASGERAPKNCIRIQDWLHGETDCWPVFFWGDLDFASMDILKRLRGSFPKMVAWREGYAPLMANLRKGEGFDAFEVEGKVQIDPGRTGCDFADAELLPLLRETGLFSHQEQ